jgi:hypothetical protein
VKRNYKSFFQSIHAEVDDEGGLGGGGIDSGVGIACGEEDF